MSHYIICLTIDVDPDGLSGQKTNRNSSSFRSFEQLKDFPDILENQLNLKIPITWFIRIDEQIKYFFGNTFYLLEKYNAFFNKLKSLDHELAWHPHIYQKIKNEFFFPESIESSCSQLASIHTEIQSSHLNFSSFRNGEGWHTNETIMLIDNLGFSVDSTAIPGIVKNKPHLLDWSKSVNIPYFPSFEDYQSGKDFGSLLEIPMNTWLVKTSYDKIPRLRYMNPATKFSIFTDSIHNNPLFKNKEGITLFTFISHPDEIIGQSTSDLLYGRTITNYISNINFLLKELSFQNNTFEFMTLQSANSAWRRNITMTL